MRTIIAAAAAVLVLSGCNGPALPEKLSAAETRAVLAQTWADASSRQIEDVCYDRKMANREGNGALWTVAQAGQHGDALATADFYARLCSRY